MNDLIDRQAGRMTAEEAIATLKANYPDACFEQLREAVNTAIAALEQPKAYTKADYVMALHKEYGCTLTRAEEAHDKALEYLRNKAIMKG